MVSLEWYLPAANLGVQVQSYQILSISRSAPSSITLVLKFVISVFKKFHAGKDLKSFPLPYSAYVKQKALESKQYNLNPQGRDWQQIYSYNLY